MSLSTLFKALNFIAVEHTPFIAYMSFHLMSFLSLNYLPEFDAWLDLLTTFDIDTLFTQVVQEKSVFIHAQTTAIFK